VSHCCYISLRSMCGASGTVPNDSTLQGKPVLKHNTCEGPWIYVWLPWASEFGGKDCQASSSKDREFGGGLCTVVELKQIAMRLDEKDEQLCMHAEHRLTHLMIGINHLHDQKGKQRLPHCTYYCHSMTVNRILFGIALAGINSFFVGTFL
jgi:hypothetical protein